MTTSSTRVGWTNIYVDGLNISRHASAIWPSEEEARAAAGEGCVATVRIEWCEPAEQAVA